MKPVICYECPRDNITWQYVPMTSIRMVTSMVPCWLEATHVKSPAWRRSTRSNTSTPRSSLTPAGSRPVAAPPADHSPPYQRTSGGARPSARHGTRELDPSSSLALFGTGLNLSRSVYEHQEQFCRSVGRSRFKHTRVVARDLFLNKRLRQTHNYDQLRPTNPALMHTLCVQIESLPYLPFPTLFINNHQATTSSARDTQATATGEQNMADIRHCKRSFRWIRYFFKLWSHRAGKNVSRQLSRSNTNTLCLNVTRLFIWNTQMPTALQIPISQCLSNAYHNACDILCMLQHFNTKYLQKTDMINQWTSLRLNAKNVFLLCHFARLHHDIWRL